MTTEVREAQETDIDKIQELSAELSEMESEEFDPTINPEWCLTEEAENWYRDRIHSPDGFATVAQEEGEVIGYAVGITVRAETFRTTEKLAELESMYLRPEYRGQGIGTQLVDEFKDWAEQKDADRLRVQASAQNQDAIDFYQKNGFQDYSLTLETDN